MSEDHGVHLQAPRDLAYLMSTPEFDAALDAGDAVDLAEVRRQVHARRRPPIKSVCAACAGHVAPHTCPGSARAWGRSDTGD